MAKTGQIILEKEDEDVRPNIAHPNTNDEQEEINRITRLMNEMRGQQNQKHRDFNDRTLLQYINDNEKRINNYVPPRDESFDDWQTKGFEGVTREKMFAFVSKVALSRPDYKFKAVRKDGFIDRIISDVTTDFYEYSWELEDPTSVEFFFDAWNAAGHGTVVRYEGIEKNDIVEEEFESYDITTGEIKGYKEKIETGEINCKSHRVKLIDFLIPDWKSPDIQIQPHCAEVAIMTRYKFELLFGEYYNADKVPHLNDVYDIWGDSFYMEEWSKLPEDLVHVTYFYEKGKKTKFRILANGVMILATPIPFKHSNYPFSRGIFKPFAEEGFYGKALPDEIAWDQDIYNALKNMIVDRSILHIQRPMITDGNNEFSDVFMSPNKILNLKGNVQTLNIDPPNQNDMQMLDYLRGSIDRQSSDVQQSGQTGKGVTAREIVIADESARKLAGVFRLFLEDFDIKATRLRVSNILQFYFEPIKIEEIIDGQKQDKLKIAYRSISIERPLKNGKPGTREISIVGKKKDLPTPDALTADVVAMKKQGMNFEKKAITADYIKKFHVDVAIIPESSFETSRSLELAMEQEYMQTLFTLFPAQFQQYSQVLFDKFNEVYDKDPDLFKNAPQQAPPPQAQPQSGQTPKTPISGELANQQPTLGKLSGAAM